MCVCVCVRVSVCVCVCMYVCMYVRTHARMYVRMYVPRRDMGDLNTMQEATMITTLFSVLATLCVTGPKGGEIRCYDML